MLSRACVWLLQSLPYRDPQFRCSQAMQKHELEVRVAPPVAQSAALPVAKASLAQLIIIALAVCKALGARGARPQFFGLLQQAAIAKQQADHISLTISDHCGKRF